MPRTATRTAAAARDALPETIAGLWGLLALVPLTTRTAYREAADLCARLSVRRLNPAQQKYFHELLPLVEEYEDARGESARTLTALRRAAARA
jgi:hypothetical protein